MKAIETEYKGYKFRSRLEARWAVFFDACGVKWEYEPEGFDLGDGIYYLPDFLLHDIFFRDSDEPNELWVEVKGQMTAADAKKIIKFANQRNTNLISMELYENPILIVTNIPDADAPEEYMRNLAYEGEAPPPFNFALIDGDYFGAFPFINKKGRLVIADANYRCFGGHDHNATKNAYRAARQARFEHGQKPLITIAKRDSIPTAESPANRVLNKNKAESLQQLINKMENKGVPVVLSFHMRLAQLFMGNYVSDKYSSYSEYFDETCEPWLPEMTENILSLERDLGTDLIIYAINQLLPISSKFRCILLDMNLRGVRDVCRIQYCQDFSDMIRDYIKQNPPIDLTPNKCGNCSFCPDRETPIKNPLVGVIPNVPPYDTTVHWFCSKETNEKFFSARNIAEAIYGKDTLPFSLNDMVIGFNVPLSHLSFNDEGACCAISLYDLFYFFSKILEMKESINQKKLKNNVLEVRRHMEAFFEKLLKECSL